MGGFGSGRHRYARTPTVEECRHLEANKLADVVDAPVGSYVDLTWSETAKIRAYVENSDDGAHAEALRLTYTTRPDSEDATEYEYRVRFDYTEPHFGGVRPWFLCPECGDRRGKLYLPPRRKTFACRECFDLAYQSSRSSGNETKRAEQRYRKAFAKADAEDRRPHPNNPPYWPTRPKGMHGETFAELCADVKDASQEWDKAVDRQMRAMLDRLESTRSLL